eukprot:7739892-Alexandrium_andersonii.AAC.1
MGGNPNPVGSPPEYAGTAATEVGSGPWTPDDWARWRNGIWYSAQPTSAPAGTQSAGADRPWQSSQAWGWSAYAGGAP